MLIEFVTGLLVGLITGLTPGIHINTAIALLLVAKDVLPFSSYGIAVVVIAAAITHTFLDIIPAIFTGIPEEDTAIAVFPSHEMVLEGRGIEAASISAFSSLLSLLLAIPVFFVFLYAFPKWISELIPVVLLGGSAVIILLQRKDMFEGTLSVWRRRLYASLVFASSGLLGYVAIKNSGLADITPVSSVLLPLLTGLFGSPTLIWSSASSPEIPEQNIASALPDIKAVASGIASGAFVSLFPGVSSGVATAIASSWISKREDYISALSSANTANALLCFAVLFATGRSRSGAAEALSNLGFEFKAEFTLFFIAAGLAACILTLALSIAAAKFVSSIRFHILSRAMLIFLLILVYGLTGCFGLIVFSIATCIGLATVMLGVRRICCMGCLIVPVLIHHF